jgi:hypothetical protein
MPGRTSGQGHEAYVSPLVDFAVLAAVTGVVAVALAVVLY